MSKTELQVLELHCHSTLSMPSPPIITPQHEIPRVRHPSYEEFFEQYIRANRPCVVSAASAGWPCSELWVRDGRVDTDYLSSRYGELRAPIADCDNLEFDAQRKEEKTVSDYMMYLNKQCGNCVSGDTPNLYLKDWHLRRERPKDLFYRVPKYFASDWLNEYALDRNEDDFMFVYIGPKGSWTPLHVDVYSSFSWSVNIVGCKRWLLLPPGEEDKLRDPLGRLPVRVASNPDTPLTSVELLQGAGDAVFVPSGWHHQVTNELDTISINHNWINGCNISMVWTALNVTLTLVEKEIEEFKSEDDFSEKCQLILKSLFGMNHQSFVEFILHIARQRLSQWDAKEKVLFGMYTLGRQHVKFDLSAVLQVLDVMLTDSTFSEKLRDHHLETMIKKIKKEIDSVLKP